MEQANQMKNKHKIVSFSGGKTSAYMAQELIKKYGHKNVTCVFANTGSEHPETLDFVQRCGERWAIDIIWLEAKVIHGQRKGTTYTVVDYESASRGNEPFEEVIKKYGLPNQKYLHCTRELKERPITAWLKDNFKKGEYEMAIGIRADEIDRVNLFEAKRRSIFYPLANMGVKKKDVLEFWKRQQFTLNIPEHYGNCVTCFKKTRRKLLTIAMDDHRWFNFMGYAGVKYKHIKSPELGRFIYRGNMTADQVVDEAHNTEFIPWNDESFSEPFDEKLDIGGGCGESCEIFSDNI